MSLPHLPVDFFVDANGCLAERRSLDDFEVILHYDDVPESDVTSVDGIRCTTVLRTVIDLAAELDSADLEQIVDECLERGMFTPREAFERIAQPDMRGRRGATLLAELLRVRPHGSGATDPTTDVSASTDPPRAYE